MDVRDTYGTLQRSAFHPQRRAACGQPAAWIRRWAFKTGHGTYLDLHNFRARDWTDALDAAGIVQRTPYVLRHTFATSALRAGINVYEVARSMGTCMKMIDRT
jgi:integrase